MIRVDDLWKKFRRFEALRGLSFDVPEGSAFAMIGANGAGKTTMIKVLMNILEPTRGSAKLLGVDSRKISPNELAQIGYVSENQDMPPRLTVAEYVAYLRPFYPGWDRDLETSIARQLRLPADRKIGHLSHGMRIKMALLCALPYRPKLLILDEPFSGLDPLVRDEFMEGLLGQAGEMTIFISSHELAEIDGVATHVGFLDEGKLLFQESMSDLTGRFREVHVTLEREASPPRQPPKEWMRMRAVGNVLTFVDTRFSEINLRESSRASKACARSIRNRWPCGRSLPRWLARPATARPEERRRAMVWHIFKKDWKLLWLFAVVVALLNWISEAIVYRLGLFGEDSMLEMLAEQLPVVAFFASAFLVVAIVHLDTLPGTRQDWLVRPMARRDLLLEKLLFTIIVVTGPIFLANLFAGLGDGFSLRASLVAGVSRVIYVLVLMVLPIFILASVTENMTQAFIFGCGCTLIIGAFGTLAQYSNNASHGTLAPILHSGVGWIAEVFRFGAVAVAAGIVLGLQYFRRKTAASRVLILAFGIVILLSSFFPWSLAFAFERHLSSDIAAGDVAKLTFDPRAGKYRSPSGVSSSANGRNDEGARVILPLRITGVRGDESLLTDRVEVRLIANGSVVYRGNGGDIEVDKPGVGAADKPAYQEIELPQSIYSANQDRALSVRLDYSLTMFRMARSYAIPALNGDERMPGWGWCQTRLNESGTAVEMHCLQAGPGPICGSVFLENTATGTRNPERSACRSDYTPFDDRPFPDNFTRFGANIPFRDPSGLAKYPVDGPQLKESKVVVQLDEPVDHFTRSVVIPQIKLRDWAAQ